MTRADAHASDILIHWDRITAELYYTVWYGERSGPTNVSSFGKGMDGNKFFYLTDDVDEDTKLWTDMCHISNAMASAIHMLVTLTYKNDYGFTYHMTFHIGLPIVHVLGLHDKECFLYALYMLKDGELVRNRIL
jgi:hypothetical protein